MKLQDAGRVGSIRTNERPELESKLKEDIKANGLKEPIVSRRIEAGNYHIEADTTVLPQPVSSVRKIFLFAFWRIPEVTRASNRIRSLTD